MSREEDAAESRYRTARRPGEPRLIGGAWACCSAVHGIRKGPRRCVVELRSTSVRCRPRCSWSATASNTLSERRIGSSTALATTAVPSSPSFGGRS